MPGVDKVLAPNDPQIAYKEKCLKKVFLWLKVFTST